MSIPLNEADLKAIIDEIDQSMEQMISILQAELRNLNDSFDRYLFQIQKHETHASVDLFQKLENARIVFEQAKIEANDLNALVEPLQNIKQVNKMVRFYTMNMENQIFVKVSSSIGAIANVCLGQLKYIKVRYESILKKIKDDIICLWMDRELSQTLRLILSVNHLQFNRFLISFHRAEILYADISLAINNREEEELHQHIVLRMISNRLPSATERRIISTLFPNWNQANN